MSDAFENRKVKADVELRVQMLNINYGRNQKLMEKCRALAEYSQFVEISREYIAEMGDYQEALNLAIDYCIDHDILSEFLRRYRAEVLGMLLEEFDVDKYERSLREEGRKEGREEGREEGTDRMARLVQVLIQLNRMEDLNRVLIDEEYRKKLFQEFAL